LGLESKHLLHGLAKVISHLKAANTTMEAIYILLEDYISGFDVRIGLNV